MKWVSEHFRDKIDFVLWTGDSARHDSDEDNARTQKEVLQLNEFMVQKMYEAFGKHGKDSDDDDPNNDFVVPVVPTFGNNDIMPHNIMVRGPNAWTRAYTKIWRQFIPEEQKHQFEQGGWFSVEVIPRKLAVFSLNTMYFFTNNAAVDGCAAHGEPGFRQMEWLRIQLQFLRERGMKAIIIGHVPPVRQDAKSLFDETCWQKYALWMRQYRDIVVSSMYGHFNYDHFVLQDFEDIEKNTEDGAMPSMTSAKDEFETKVSNDYFLQLRDQWSELPSAPRGVRLGQDAQDESTSDGIIARLRYKLLALPRNDHKKQERKQRKYFEKMGGKYAERFAASFVSASIVPNLFPTLRVFEYNTSGLDSAGLDTAFDYSLESIDDFEDTEFDISKRKKKRKYKFKVPEGPSKSAPPGPAYSPQTFSLLRYTQYMANLTHINNDFTNEAVNDTLDVEKWHEGKHKGKKPHDKDHKPNPKTFKFDQYYDTKDDEVYHLKDLTVPSLVDLAQRIGEFIPENEDVIDQADSMVDDIDIDKKKKKKHGKKHRKDKHPKKNLPWYTFIRRAFVETMNPEEIREEFGQ
ncbi:hypothetical protein AMS68_007715 [Peltaster fructicola]|uniref:Endopolyphosphatase n=1 Tax=Peltaster fructicola TaxID=286661 RepID=A0A6H0Y5T1_9PEZI|nr:hypothetical protein AMS68_007715 [Peltaster fructicola]